MGNMRAARFLFVVFLILAVAAAGLYVFRLPVASFAVRSVMASAGVENPKAEVAALSVSGVMLRNVAGGPENGEAFDIQEIEARYHWRALIFDRKIDALRIGPGTVRVAISSDGEISLPGVSLNRGEGDGGALPFSTLAVDDIVILVDAPLGVARGMLSADYDIAAGGAASIHLEADKSGYDAAYIENGIVTLDVDLSQDGAMTGAGELRGDLFSSHGAIRNLNITMQAKGRSWRDLANGLRDGVSGDLRVEVKSAMVNIDDLQSASMITSDQSALLFGEPVTSLTFAGGINVLLSEGVISADLGGVPLVAGADNGAQLVIAALSDDPLFRRENDVAQANFSFTLNGARISANGTVNAATTEDGWFIVTPMRIGDYRSSDISFDDASAILRITVRPVGVSADITTTTNLREISIGRLSVFDTPFAANFLIDTDNTAKTARLTLPLSQCVTIDHAHITIAQQDTEATFKDAKLCAQDRPLAILDWSGDMRSDFAGTLSASYLSYRLGQTNIAGRSPVVAFSGVYQPAIHQTNVTGDISGGALTFNDMLVFSSVDGKYDFSLDQQLMGSTVRLNSVRITQNEETPKIAPVMGSGVARLIGKEAEFDYVLETPAGVRLGAGEGIHDVETARGRSTLVFDQIKFEPGGLQPNILAPVMKGVIGETAGVVTGEADFTWAPDPIGLTSSASFQFDDITFGGPTRVVTKTIGVNGRLDFANLWPVKTDGPQTITVSGVDFGALQLEQGEINFDMPGDETLRVAEATFPWFGGMLSVHDATASFAGGDAVAHLNAEDIDLAQILEYVDAEGLSGEGLLSGVLPLVVEDGKARIENGELRSTTSGAIRYQGQAVAAASTEGQDAQIAFDLLRDLQFSELGVTVNGALDGRLQFQLIFEGTGELELNQQNVRVPVIYRINLDAAVLELLNQAALSQNLRLQIQQGLQGNP
jgi:Dicarboxylate transport